MSGFHKEVTNGFDVVVVEAFIRSLGENGSGYQWTGLDTDALKSATGT